jgi:hypothetical protein
LSTRHVASFTELTPEAADELGGLVRRLDTALEAVAGCVGQGQGWVKTWPSAMSWSTNCRNTSSPPAASSKQRTS